MLNKEDRADKVDEAHFRSLVGCLMYLTSTKPDILFPVSVLSRFMPCASELHFEAAKKVVGYIKGAVSSTTKYKTSNYWFRCFLLVIQLSLLQL